MMKIVRMKKNATIAMQRSKAIESTSDIELFAKSFKETDEESKMKMDQVIPKS
jgi:hypothetical protein